ATALLGAPRPNPAGAQRLLIAGSNKKSRCRRATAPTPRSVPRHGDLLVTVIKRRHASAQRLLIAGSNKK
ncbi:MAG: hypothetical protein RR278_07235, partial [Mucinivorans sp.]